jgi:hypothetical protein
MEIAVGWWDKLVRCQNPKCLNPIFLKKIAHSRHGPKARVTTCLMPTPPPPSPKLLFKKMSFLLFKNPLYIYPPN